MTRPFSSHGFYLLLRFQYAEANRLALSSSLHGANDGRFPRTVESVLFAAVRTPKVRWRR
jgi:hypothetical protein